MPVFVIPLRRRHDNTNYARRNNEILTGKGTKITLKFSCAQVEIVSARCVFLSSPNTKVEKTLFRLDRRHDNTKYASRNKKIVTGERMKITPLKFPCPWVEIFCVRAFLFVVSSPNADVEIMLFRSGRRHASTGEIKGCLISAISCFRYFVPTGESEISKNMLDFR